MIRETLQQFGIPPPGFGVFACFTREIGQINVNPQVIGKPFTGQFVAFMSTGEVAEVLIQRSNIKQCVNIGRPCFNNFLADGLHFREATGLGQCVSLLKQGFSVCHNLRRSVFSACRRFPGAGLCVIDADVVAAQPFAERGQQVIFEPYAGAVAEG